LPADLYWYETLFSYFEEGHELQISENKVLMIDTKPKKYEATEQFKITHKKKFIKLLTILDIFGRPLFFI
jgi:FMN-dependent NADH-azoreductase